MPITRAKATALLNQREMALYDDSRANAIRELDEKALSVRISRARALRDRARDLVQRQKLSSRDKTGNKRGTSGIANQRSKDKVELTTDILRRFEAQLDKVADANTGTGTGKKAAKKSAKKAARTPARKSASRRSDRRDARKATRNATRSAKAAKSAAKKSPASKTAAGKTTKAATRKAAARKTKSAAPKGDVAKKASTKTAENKRSAAAKPASARQATAARTPAAKSPVAKAPRKKAGKPVRKAATTKPLTPRQALKRTQSLLKAKQERDRAPKPWESLAGGASAPGQPGYQSGAAARRAQELHAGESRMPAIKGSISTRDRINQGKRDNRNSG